MFKWIALLAGSIFLGCWIGMIPSPWQKVSYKDIATQRENLRRLRSNTFKLISIRAPKEPRVFVEEGDNVTIKVICQDLETGKVLFSSFDESGEDITAQAGLKQFLPGLDKAILKMSLGEIVEVTLSADLAFGQRGFMAWNVLPFTDVLFEIQLTKVVKLSSTPLIAGEQKTEEIQNTKDSDEDRSKKEEVRETVVNVDGQTS